MIRTGIGIVTNTSLGILGKRILPHDWYVFSPTHLLLYTVCAISHVLSHSPGYNNITTFADKGFVFPLGILHYQWSNNPAALQDPLNKALASIANAILWASSAWYAKTGVKDNAVLLGLSAALHAYSVFSH